MAEANVYAACDRAIRNIDREILRDFGQLKLTDWDEVHVIRTVKTVYRKSRRKAKQQYYEVAFEAYLLALAMCGYDQKKAYPMAEKAINDEWVSAVLEDVDPVTMYSFDAETERKAERLAETLEVAQDRSAEIDKAIRYWSRQCGQYAINFTDYAMVEAFTDAGVERVRWITQKDEKVCGECAPRDEQIFPIDEIPSKHWACRCYLRPVL